MIYIPNLVPMPDEVIDELSRSDIDLEGVYDEEYIAQYDELSSGYGRRAKPNYMGVCKNCGYKGLAWTQFPQGLRLTYTWGQLQGKIHACMNEL